MNPWTLGLFLILLVPAEPSAWGMEIHRRITARALDGLPAPLREFYAKERAFVIEHSVDPDLWRVVNLRTQLGAEDPNHFLDIDALDEPEPFTGVPRDWDKYLARYGEARVERAGRLPWRVEEVYTLLVGAWKAHASGKAPYAASNARYLSAVLAHYLEDANQPFHAVANYDGQLTNQRGIHSRFETELPTRYWNRITHARVVITPVPNVKTFIFDRVTEGVRLSKLVLDADLKALAPRPAGAPPVYDDGYYARFFQAARPVLETRLASSANAVASVWVQAWADAGRPAID